MLKQHILDIFYAITAIRKVQHIKPSSEKIYQYLHKINKDAEKSLIISTIENLVRNGYLKVEGEGENESIFILKSFEDFFNLLIEYSKNHTNDKNSSVSNEITELENFIDTAEKRNNGTISKSSLQTNNYGLLYERMIAELKSDVAFLREQTKNRDSYFLDEINFLRKQLENQLDSKTTKTKREVIYLHQPDSPINSSNKPHHSEEDPIKINDNENQKATSATNRNERKDLNATNINSKSPVKQSTKQKHEKPKRNSQNESSKSPTKKKKRIFILGDGIVKHTEGWEISNKLKNEHKVFVRFFSSAKVKCMKDYVKPCIRENEPDHIILHVGTNNLSSEQSAERIAKSIVDLAKLSVKDHCPVSISSIVPRNDEWNNKAQEVNRFLEDMCLNYDINYITNSKAVNPRRHLNNGEVHLNLKGATKLMDVFTEAIKGLFPN